MPQSSRITIVICGAIITSSLCPSSIASQDYVFNHENVLGTSLELCIRADSRAAAARVEQCVLSEIDRLALIFSGYDQGSELSRWQSAPGNPVRVSRELYDVLLASDRWIAQSEGAFDPRVEVFSRLWERCSHLGRVPTTAETTAARAMLKTPAWRLNPTGRTAERLSECPLSLNGIAKGFIVEKACDFALATSAGVSGMLLNVGGDLRVVGETPRTIGIAAPWADSESSEPLTFIEVKDRSVATSGKSQRGFEIDGKWYSHVFDPRSGSPVEQVLSATVVAVRGTDADVLAKVCSVLEPDLSLHLVSSIADAECLIVTADGRTRASAGWHRLERTRPVLLAPVQPQKSATSRPKTAADPTKDEPKAAPRPAWDNDFELVVSFEINLPEAEKGRYRRPYVAVWAEDSDGKSVRTLALWVSLSGSGPFQWLPDLKRWYKSDDDRKLAGKKDIFFTISRPTRPSGKYKLIWDGKDNDGKVLGGGEYTIFIEAAREHGTYQNIRKQVSLTNKPFREDLKGNVEIRSASIEYHRKTAAK
jgi:thiamine biosynthesis lipoprotein